MRKEFGYDIEILPVGHVRDYFCTTVYWNNQTIAVENHLSYKSGIRYAKKIIRQHRKYQRVKRRFP